MQEIKKRFIGIVDNITSEYGFFLYIAVVMAALPVVELFDQMHGNQYQSQPIIMEMAGLFGVFTVIAYFLRNQNCKYYLSDVLYLLMFMFAIITAVFSLDQEETFFGFNYDEWLTHFFAYFSLMFAGTMISDNKYRKNLLKIFVAITVLQCTIAFFQTFDIRIDDVMYGGRATSAIRSSYGLLQNTNWYGGLTVLMFAAVSGIYLYTEKLWVRNISYGLSVLCFYTLIASEARLAWVGSLAYLIFLMISFKVMKKNGFSQEKLKRIWKRFGILIIGIAAAAVICDLIGGHLTKRFNSIRNEFKYRDFDKFGSSRGYIWKYGIESVPKHLWLGVGLDNFKDAFFLNPRFTEGDKYQQKGHNEYLHILVTQGIFQLLNYLTLYVYAAVRGVRTVIHTDDDENRYITWIFLGMFTGYAAQAFFNSSITNVAPYFWISVGMCLSKKNQNHLKFKQK